MLLGVMWMMTALVTGFMVGRISMYGMWESEEEQGSGRRRAAQDMEKKGALSGGRQSNLERGKPCIRRNSRSGGGRASDSNHLS